jgi:hypothetical protein
MILEKTHVRNQQWAIADPEMREVVKPEIIRSVIPCPRPQEVMIAKGHDKIQASEQKNSHIGQPNP